MVSKKTWQKAHYKIQISVSLMSTTGHEEHWSDSSDVWSLYDYDNSLEEEIH